MKVMDYKEWAKSLTPNTKGWVEKIDGRWYWTVWNEGSVIGNGSKSSWGAAMHAVWRIIRKHGERNWYKQIFGEWSPDVSLTKPILNRTLRTGLGLNIEYANDLWWFTITDRGKILAASAFSKDREEVVRRGRRALATQVCLRQERGY